MRLRFISTTDIRTIGSSTSITMARLRIIGLWCDILVSHLIWSNTGGSIIILIISFLVQEICVSTIKAYETFFIARSIPSNHLPIASSNILRVMSRSFALLISSRWSTIIILCLLRPTLLLSWAAKSHLWFLWIFWHGVSYRVLAVLYSLLLLLSGNFHFNCLLCNKNISSEMI